MLVEFLGTLGVLARDSESLEGEQYTLACFGGDWVQHYYFGLFKGGRGGVGKLVGADEIVW